LISARWFRAPLYNYGAKIGVFDLRFKILDLRIQKR
jgi:hypothetical protein